MAAYVTNSNFKPQHNSTTIFLLLSWPLHTDTNMLNLNTPPDLIIPEGTTLSTILDQYPSPLQYCVQPRLTCVAC